MPDVERAPVVVRLTIGETRYEVGANHLEDLTWEWGSNAFAAEQQIRMVTASGSLVILQEAIPAQARDDYAECELLIGGVFQVQGLAIPIQHEEYRRPKYLAYRFQGTHIGPLRRTRNLFISPRTAESAVSSLLDVPTVWSSTLPLSYVTGQMSAMQMLNELAMLCGGPAVESSRGVPIFVNYQRALEETSPPLYDASYKPENDAFFLTLRTTVRASAQPKSTLYLPDANNPVYVGSLSYTGNTLRTFEFDGRPPGGEYITRIITDWEDPTLSGDGTLAWHGRSGSYFFLRRPTTGGQAKFPVSVSARPNQSGFVDFRADVSNLQVLSYPVDRLGEPDGTFGYIDARLAPWTAASKAGYLSITRPWLRRLSQPLKLLTVTYNIWQRSAAAARQLADLSPGITALIEIPTDVGSSQLVRVLVLAARITAGRGQKPQRTICGLVLDISAPVSPIEIDAEALGPFDARLTAYIANPSSSRMAYARFREAGTDAWTDLTAQTQAPEIEWGISTGLEAAHNYEAEAGLDSAYDVSDIDSFTTDTGPDARESPSFDLHADNTTPQALTRIGNVLHVLNSATKSVFFYQYGLYVERTALPSQVLGTALDIAPGLDPDDDRYYVLSRVASGGNAGIWVTKCTFDPSDASFTYVSSGLVTPNASSTDRRIRMLPEGVTVGSHNVGDATIITQPQGYTQTGGSAVPSLIQYPNHQTETALAVGYYVQDAGPPTSKHRILREAALQTPTADLPADAWSAFRFNLAGPIGIAQTLGLSRTWILDSITDRVYAYLPDGTEVTDREEDVRLRYILINGALVPGFDPAVTRYYVNKGHTNIDAVNGQVFVDARPVDPEAISLVVPRGIVSFDSAPSPPNTIQPTPPSGSKYWKITVESETRTSTRVYEVIITPDDTVVPPPPPPPPPPPEEPETGTPPTIVGGISPNTIVDGQSAVINAVATTSTDPPAMTVWAEYVPEMGSPFEFFRSSSPDSEGRIRIVDRKLTGPSNDRIGTHDYRISAMDANGTTIRSGAADPPDTEWQLTITAAPVEELPEIDTFVVDRTDTVAPGAANVRWTTTNATGVRLTWRQPNGTETSYSLAADANRSFPGLAAGLHTFTLRAVKTGETEFDELQRTAWIGTPQMVPTAPALSVSPTTGAPGDARVLTYAGDDRTDNIQLFLVRGGQFIPLSLFLLPRSGTWTVRPSETLFYRAVAYNEAGSSPPRDLAVVVTGTPTPPPPPVTPIDPEELVAIDPLRVIPNDTTLNTGESREIRFSVRHCDRVVYAVYELGTNRLIESRTFTPPLGNRNAWGGSRTFTAEDISVRVQATAYGSRGIGVTRSRLLFVTTRGAPTARLTVDPTTIDLGSSAILSFRAKDAVSIAISGFTDAEVRAGITHGVLGVSKWVSGTLTITPRGDTSIPGSSNRSTTYRMVVAGHIGGDLVTDTATIIVRQPAIVQRVNECLVVSENRDNPSDPVVSYYMEPQMQRIRGTTVVAGDRVWWRTSLNPLRGSVLGTANVALIAPGDTIAAAAIITSYTRGLSGRAINASLQGVSNLVATCAIACETAVWARQVGQIGPLQAIADDIINVVRGQMGPLLAAINAGQGIGRGSATLAKAASALGSVGQKISAFLSLPGVQVILGPLNVYGLLSTLTNLFYVFQGLHTGGAAMLSTLTILDNIFVRTNTTTIPRSALRHARADQTWHRPRFTYNYNYDSPNTDGVPVTLTFFNDFATWGFSGTVRPILNRTRFDDIYNGNVDVFMPEMHFQGQDGIRLDDTLFDLIQFAETLLPGCRIGSIRNATVTDIVDV